MRRVHMLMMVAAAVLAAQVAVAGEGEKRMRAAQSDKRMKSYRVTGTVENLKSMDFVGIEATHLLAKVKTSKGDMIKVDFGPRQRLQRALDLQSGDRVKIWGHRGHVNKKSVLMARKVKHDGEAFKVKRQKGRDYRQFRGEVVALQTMKRKGHPEHRHVVATVRTREGQKRRVALGTKPRIRDIGLEQGDRIRFVARPCKMNGEKALVAKHIRHAGESYTVNKKMRKKPRGYRLSGKVTGMKTMKLSGARQDHALARLQTKDGHTLKVDLGPKRLVRQKLDLSQGDRITVVGRRGHVDDQSIFIAHKIMHDGDTVRIKRTRTKQYRQFEGEVASFKEMKLRGDGKRRHTVAEVRLADGGRRRVALGQRQRVDRIGIERGDRIQFTARPCKIDGDKGLLAKHIRHAGDRYVVNKKMR